jgi:hypothetical protein
LIADGSSAASARPRTWLTACDTGTRRVRRSTALAWSEWVHVGHRAIRHRAPAPRGTTIARSCPSIHRTASGLLAGAKVQFEFHDLVPLTIQKHRLVRLDLGVADPRPSRTAAGHRPKTVGNLHLLKVNRSEPTHDHHRERRSSFVRDRDVGVGLIDFRWQRYGRARGMAELGLTEHRRGHTFCARLRALACLGHLTRLSPNGSMALTAQPVFSTQQRYAA